MDTWDKIKLLHLDEYITKNDTEYVIDEFAFTSRTYEINGGDITSLSDFLKDIPNGIKNKFILVKSNLPACMNCKAGISMVLMCEYIDYSLIIFKNNPSVYFLCKLEKSDNIKILPKLHPEYFCLPNCSNFKSKEDVLNTPYTVILNKDFQESILELPDYD